MDVLNLFTSTYGVLRNYGMPFWVMTPFRKVVRGLANIVLPYYLSRPTKRKGRLEKGLIVSLTSFPARIGDVWKVVECLKRQTVLPEKIILWLTRSQFPNGKGIPDKLKKQIDNLFEIKFVEENVRSHTKYLFAFREYPQKAIITCDDDIYYDINMVERLVSSSKRFPNCIIANGADQLKYDTKENLLPYIQWNLQYKSNIREYESNNLVQLGVTGVLYPPHCLHKLIDNSDLFMRIAPLADDIWLNAMARLNHTPVVKASGHILLLPILNNAPKLCSVNNGPEKMNDMQISQIRSYLLQNGYPDVYACSYMAKEL